MYEVKKCAGCMISQLLLSNFLCSLPSLELMYRDEIYCLQNLLSRTQAVTGRTVKKEQE